MNILYLHTHDTGRVISSYGYKVHTPNYQALIEDSLLFQQAFSVAPTCSPSRAGLLTGVYPHQNGMLGLAQRGFDLEKEKHLAHILAQNGYHTALCGVQHEIGYYTDHEMAVDNLGYQEDLSENHREYNEKDLVIWDEKNADRLANWLEAYDAAKPFFVSYGMHATHRAFPDTIHPEEDPDYSQPALNLPNNEVTRKDFAQYKTSLRTADENIGKVIAALKKSGRYDETIILLTTDHGLAYPFEKCTLNDSGIGVLMAMRVPNSKTAAKSYEGLISHIDVLPTLFDLIKLEKPAYLEGKSFAALFAGENYLGDDAIFGEINFHTSYEPVRAVRTKRYKYIRYFDESYLKINRSNIDHSPVKTLFTEGEHSLETLTKASEYLFDLQYDAFEKNNLASEPAYQETLEQLRDKLKSFMEKTNDPLLQGPIEIRPEWKVNKRQAYAAGSKNPEDYDSLGIVEGGKE
jgi:N-sulfoglucosamine sulfohydrolase